MASLSEKNARLQEYRAAESAVLRNQSYSIKDRQFTKADLLTIQKGIKDLENEIAMMTQGGMRVRRVIPRDD